MDKFNIFTILIFTFCMKLRITKSNNIVLCEEEIKVISCEEKFRIVITNITVGENAVVTHDVNYGIDLVRSKIKRLCNSRQECVLNNSLNNFTQFCPSVPRNVTYTYQCEFTYVGCFADYNKRILDTFHAKTANMSARICSEICSAKIGWTYYFATENGNECLCGDGSKLNEGLYQRVKESKCHMPCENNIDEKCGGSYGASVYTTITNITNTSNIRTNNCNSKNIQKTTIQTPNECDGVPSAVRSCFDDHNMHCFKQHIGLREFNITKYGFIPKIITVNFYCEEFACQPATISNKGVIIGVTGVIAVGIIITVVMVCIKRNVGLRNIKTNTFDYENLSDTTENINMESNKIPPDYNRKGENTNLKIVTKEKCPIILKSTGQQHTHISNFDDYKGESANDNIAKLNQTVHIQDHLYVFRELETRLKENSRTDANRWNTEMFCHEETTNNRNVEFQDVHANKNHRSDVSFDGSKTPLENTSSDQVCHKVKKSVLHNIDTVHSYNVLDPAVTGFVRTKESLISLKPETMKELSEEQPNHKCKGTIAINNASVENDQQYLLSVCDDDGYDCVNRTLHPERNDTVYNEVIEGVYNTVNYRQNVDRNEENYDHC